MRADRASPRRAVGRGTGLDAAGLERKRATVAAALAPPRRAAAGAASALRRVGGLELAALAGAVGAAATLRLPVMLDGYAIGVAALAAVAPRSGWPARVLIAGHRSAEPGHELVLTELGLEPLLDLRLRLGEASGALLALPLIEAAGALHRQMGTFEEAGVAARADEPAAWPRRRLAGGCSRGLLGALAFLTIVPVPAAGAAALRRRRGLVPARRRGGRRARRRRARSAPSRARAAARARRSRWSCS